LRLFKRDGVWYADLHVGGRRQKVSTRCTDRRAAEAVARQLERDAADPDHATARKATLSDALKLLTDTRESEAKAGKKSVSTVGFYRKKAGHWVRMLETNDAGDFVPYPLSRLRAADVDRCVAQRRTEGAGEGTIAKELVTLRAALKLAKRAGMWRGDIDEVLPVGFAPEYKPRERALTYAEAFALLAELTADRAARVAFILATSANWNESERARRPDINRDRTEVTVRGTKRATRHRVVPIVSEAQRALLEHAMAHAQGPGDPMFTRWINVRRDLHAACERAKIPPCTPNDLRRTCATWLRAEGLPPHLLGPLMGHADSRMVERVYGRLSPAQLAQRMAAELGVTAPTRGPHAVQSHVDRLDATDGLDDAETQKAAKKRGFVVPRDRIELPTRGFSILWQNLPTPRIHLFSGDEPTSAGHMRAGQALVRRQG